MAPRRIGRYEIQRRLGTGGMGALYLARDPGLDRLVAIKLLREDYQDDPDLRERFIREARSVARLRHPNIVIVHDVGEDEGRPFMAMEYIAGDTLTQVLRRAPSLPIAKRLALVEDLCAGLAHAHSAGIIHRDIKPANIMLDGEGVLKILDFGIARLGNSGMTQEGMMMGTVNYMSPEQVTGRGVDHRTDIFATGAVLYEAIALEQAFPGRIDTGVLHRILEEGPIPLEQRVPGVDHELAGIVRQALERDAAQRYQDVNVMRLDVARVRRRLIEEGNPEMASVPDTTVVDQPKPSPSRPGPKVESDHPRRLAPERFAELRRQQVEEHLRFGEEAFARGEHDAALQHAERAATVDPDSRAAFDLIDKARFAIEAKAIRQLLAEAQRLLSDGHIEDAAALADEASVTLPDVHGAAELRREVRQTSEKITVARDREQRIGAALDRARSSIDRGGYETALRAVYEVLALDPERPEARALEQQAQGRLQAQREHERARRGAYEQLTRARTLADDGKYDEAVDAIDAVSAPSDTVRVAAADALTAVRKAQRQAGVAAIVAKAREALGRGRFVDVLAAVDSIPAEDQTADALALRASAERALREQQEQERKRQAFEAALGAVQALIDGGDFVRAREHLEDAARIGPGDERVPALRQQITERAAEADARRREQARDRMAAKRVEAARQLLANGDGYAAVALLERDGSGHPLVEEALREIRAAVAAHEERVRQEAERRRQEEEARRRAETEAARRLEEQQRAEEQRRRREEERRRREIEQQRRRDEVATLLVSAQEALAADRPDEATLFLKRADEQVGSVEDTELRRRVAAAKAEAERQERQRQQEVRKREEEARKRERALTEILAKVRATPAHDAALDLLQEALAIAPTDARVQTLVQERRAALERQREEEERREHEARRREEERRIQEQEARRLAELEAARLREEQRRAAEQQRQEEEQQRRRLEVAKVLTAAEQALGADRLDEAAGLLKQAETMVHGDADAAQRLGAARAEAARRTNAVRRREEEARRQEQEARTRDEALASLLTKAREVDAHEVALTILGRAQTLAPGDPRVQTLIHERHAALDAERTAAAAMAAEEAARREREWRAQQERDAQAGSAVEQARQLFSSGQHDEAIALLRRSPVHALTQTAFDELESRRIAIERQREYEERRRQRRAQRAASFAAFRGVAGDRRVHLAGGTVLIVALVAGIWQFWSAPSPAVDSSAPGASATDITSPATPPTSITEVQASPPTPEPGQPPTASPPPTPESGNNAPRTGPRVAESRGAAPPAGAGPTPASRGSAPPADPRPTAESGRAPQPASPPISASASAAPQTGPGPTPESPAAPAAVNPAPGPSSTSTAPPPATGPRVDLAADRASIQQLLGQYVSAYNRMDDRRLREIDPTFNGIQRRELINTVTLSLPQVSIDVAADGQSARLTAIGTYSYDWKRDRLPANSPAALNWRLVKRGGSWTVER